MNNFAESNLDILEGMERSAAALSATGTTLQESLALFTGGQEVLQNSEKMGNALRSVAMRIRSFNEESEDGFAEVDEELKNITGDLIDLTKTANHKEGISIFKEGSTTEFRSLVDYFGDIHDIWDEMSQKQQNDFLLKAFGRTQSQAGSAIIKNFDSVRNALEKMEEAGGSADREMQTVEQSLSYRINSLKETWTGIYQSLIDRGDFGTIVSGLTKVSEAIGKVTKDFGLLGTVLLGGGIFKAFKSIGKTDKFVFNQVLYT